MKFIISNKKTHLNVNKSKISFETKTMKSRLFWVSQGIKG